MADIDWAAMHASATTYLDGEFPVVITEAEAAMTSTGKPCIKVKAKVESGAHAGFVLAHMFTISMDSPVAKRIFFGDMEVLGLNAAFFATGPTTEAVAQALVDKRATVLVKPEEYNERTSEKIKRWSKANAFTPFGGPIVAPTPVVTTAPVTMPAETPAGPSDVPPDPF